jgi:glycosyltransferase involved in cell wall biosynthesis
MIKYSIIVATYNRLSEIRELLDSLQGLTYPPSDFEVIIVDDGSIDGTSDYVINFNSTFDLRCLSQENQGPGKARNLGMAQAKGEYFIFVDSDCTMPSQWLDSIDEAVIRHDWDAFGGPDTFHPSFSPLLKAINYSMTSFVGTGGTRGGKESVGRYYPRSFNMGMRRSVYDKVGGMNQLRHGQDMDLSARIYDAGFRVGLIPEAFVYHKRRTSLTKFFRQIFNWGVARVNLGRTHKQLWKFIHFIPAFLLLGSICIFVFSMVSGHFWIIKGITIAYILVLSWIFFESYQLYKSVKISLLSILTTNIQVIAYGLGMIWAWPQMLTKGHAEGFVKRYYGKGEKDSR